MVAWFNYAENFVISHCSLELFQSANGEPEVKRNYIGQLFREAQQSESTFDVLFFGGGGVVVFNVSRMYSDAFFFYDIQTYCT